MASKDFFVDLHIHTNYSDGVFSPTEVVAYASKVGLTAIAITDHDTVDGIAEAMNAGKQSNIEVISGIELSAEYGDVQKTEMHILGYYVDWKSTKLKETLDIFKNARTERAKEIFSRLWKIGIKLNPEGLIVCIEKKVIGRLHFAKVLIENGIVASVQEAFQKYLSTDQVAYVPKYSITPKQAIELIRDSGGIPVLAHPYYGHYNNIDVIKGLVDDGLQGIEVWHNRHPEHVVRKLLSIADELNLIATGGSDCHGVYGNQTTPLIGKIKVPYSVIESLEKEKQKI
jgi:hypothetical protein